MLRSQAARRRPLTMTSLIDVIFLLLLFFMLSSSFSRFAEIELATGGDGQSNERVEVRTYFLQVSARGLRLNGREIPAEALPNLLTETDEKVRLIVSLAETALSQNLADVLSQMQGLAQVDVSVLGGRS